VNWEGNMMLITIIFKALITAIVLFLTFNIGRCSATHDIYDVRIGKRDKMPDDIIRWVKCWDEKRIK